MSHYGPPDDPGYYSDQPTGHGGYGRQPPGEPPPGPPERPGVPWYRRPWALVGFGALGALLFVLIVFLIFGGSNSTPKPVGPISSTSRTAGDDNDLGVAVADH